MLREKQKKLEERIADVQAQNFKLNKLVIKSNVETVEQAIKEKNSAKNQAVQERLKAEKAIKNAKQEINKTKRQAKDKIRFWQVFSMVALGISLIVGYYI